MSKQKGLDNDKSILEKKIDEYNYVSEFFNIKDGKLEYDHQMDQYFAIDNVERKKEYLGYESFMEYVDNKTRKELEKELYAIQDKLLHEKEATKVINPSKEQKAIINNIANNKSIIVDAVAGSGKTTTVLFIAQKNPEKSVLQITYNKELKLEVRNKVQVKNLNNLEIHTYHSLAVKFYDHTAHTDDKMIKIISENIRPKKIKKYDIVIVDEVQDMTPNYYSLICKFLIDMDLLSSLLVILGDRYQGIYEFKNADLRFLTMSHKIWTNILKNKNCMALPLQESYRVTKQIAWFVNNAMLGQNRITSNKEGKHPVYYYKKNKFIAHTIFAKEISKFLKMGYNPSDIFVLAYSVKGKGNNPIKKLENLLVQENIPVYFSRDDEEGIDENIIKGKVAFTSFHQSKGRERKIVFIYGFEESYFDFYAKDKDRNVCPSELYVATTRASEILVLLEHDSDNQMPFMQHDHDAMQTSGMVKVIKNTNVKPVKIKKDKKPIEKDLHNTTVSELTKYIDEETLKNLGILLAQICEIEKEPKKKTTVNITSSIKTNGGLTEDVSDLNGMVIPAMYERKLSEDGTSTLEKMIGEMYRTADPSTKKFIDEKTPELKKTSKQNEIAYYLCIGNLYVTLSEKIYSKLKQIDKYDWLTKEMVDMCKKNISSNILKSAQYEQELGQCENENGKFFQYITNTYGTINIKGRVDCYDDEVLWEFKCVESLQLEHMLQLVVYMWIWEKSMKKNYGKRKFKLLNIRTGEVREIKYKSHVIDEIMDVIFINKYIPKEKDDDAEFIQKCIKSSSSLINANKGLLGKNMFVFTDNGSKKKKDLEEDIESINEDDKIYKVNMFAKKPTKIVKNLTN